MKQLLRSLWHALTRRRTVPWVMQSESNECALACLAMIAQHHGASWGLAELRRRFQPSARGTSVRRVMDVAQAIGFDVRAFRLEPQALGALALPCILHWDLNHFVVLERIDARGTHVLDPGVGRCVASTSELDRRFTGIAVECRPGPGFGSARTKDDRTLAFLTMGLRNSVASLAAILVLAFVLELLAVAAPLLIQAVTDRVIPAFDTRLLAILTAGFLLVTTVQSLVSAARSSMLIRLGAALTTGWHTTVAGRLLSLPYVFFVRRSIGDIHSRFGSIEAIQRTVTTRFVEGALDGVTAVLSLAMIVYYSPRLAALTLGAALAYVGLRWLTFARIRAAEERAIGAHASQQSLLLEILHGVHSIKANGFEPVQLSRYSARTDEAARANSGVQHWVAGIAEAGGWIHRAHRILAIGIGGLLAIEGHLSAGMLVAYLAYASQFAERTSRLADLMSEWRMLLLHGERLSEIVTAASEPGLTAVAEASDETASDIRIESLRFRYSPEDPWVIDDADLHVAEGECVAIRGASGSGKSTLAKLMVGLLDAEHGRIRLGGLPIERIGKASLRRRVGCVLQEDQLFSGTIAENIAFFEPDYDRAGIDAAARAAQIHDEIMALPMGYETPLIDLGASLSGGQRQRLILARALYRRPSVLVLDEASSHLDLENERLVNDAIKALDITRIIIAHRPETLAIADRVLELTTGILVPVHVAARNDPRMVHA